MKATSGDAGALESVYMTEKCFTRDTPMSNYQEKFVFNTAAELARTSLSHTGNDTPPYS